MDAFFASIEQRDDPSLKGKPVAVGGSRQRGVVAAASYEARKFGVRSAMPSVTAKKKCPGLIFVSPRFPVYKEASRQIREIFLEYTDLVEPLSLDEAFLDVTDNKKQIELATDIAMEIKEKIKKKTELTASAGVSVNKFLAKIASDYDKPDGLFIIKPHQTEEFVEKLAIEKFFGIGKVTAKKMHKIGIHTGKDLKSFPLEELLRLFGKAGNFYYSISRGIDDRPVDPNRIRKSIGNENTFESDLNTLPDILFELKEIENELVRRIKNSGARGKTLTLKIKFEDFEQITRSKSLQEYFTPVTIHTTSVDLISQVELTKGIRLLGLSLSNLENTEVLDAYQLEIDFDNVSY